jgi:hypothetical protein
MSEKLARKYEWESIWTTEFRTPVRQMRRAADLMPRNGRLNRGSRRPRMSKALVEEMIVARHHWRFNLLELKVVTSARERTTPSSDSLDRDVSRVRSSFSRVLLRSGTGFANLQHRTVASGEITFPCSRKGKCSVHRSPASGGHSRRECAPTLHVFGIQTERRRGERIPVDRVFTAFFIHEQRGGGLI